MIGITLLEINNSICVKDYLTMLKLLKTLIKPGGEISLDHEIPDDLLPLQGDPITDGSSLHTILAFHSLLFKKVVKKSKLYILSAIACIKGYVSIYKLCRELI